MSSNVTSHSPMERDPRESDPRWQDAYTRQLTHDNIGISFRQWLETQPTNYEDRK